MKQLSAETQRELVEALEGMASFAKDFLDWSGGCDHSVGICVCPEMSRVYTAMDTLAKARAEMGAP